MVLSYWAQTSGMPAFLSEYKRFKKNLLSFYSEEETEPKRALSCCFCFCHIQLCSHWLHRQTGQSYGWALSGAAEWRICTVRMGVTAQFPIHNNEMPSSAHCSLFIMWKQPNRPAIKTLPHTLSSQRNPSFLLMYWLCKLHHHVTVKLASNYETE